MSKSLLDVDKLIGSRIRTRRIFLGISQEKLALSIGVSFQQVQKYESGVNKVSASRLYEFSKVLEVQVSYFFHEPINRQNDHKFDPLERKETHDLIKAYYNIKGSQVRHRVTELLKTLSL